MIAASRSDEARSIVATLSQRRETDKLLARAGQGMLAAMLRIPEKLARTVAESPRLAARTGSMVRRQLGITESKPHPLIAPFLKDVDKARQLASAVGMAMALGTCRVALLKAEIVALRRLHGPDILDFAFRHHGAYAVSQTAKLSNAMILHDAAGLRNTGQGAILAWAEKTCGAGAEWLKVAYPDYRANTPSMGQEDITANLISDWFSA